jgi:hypothetical protein
MKHPATSNPERDDSIYDTHPDLRLAEPNWSHLDRMVAHVQLSAMSNMTTGLRDISLSSHPLPSPSTADNLKTTERPLPSSNLTEASYGVDSDIEMSAEEPQRVYAFAAPKLHWQGLTDQTPAGQDPALEVNGQQAPKHEDVIDDKYDDEDECDGRDEDDVEDEYDVQEHGEDKEIAELEELMVPPGMRSVLRSAYHLPRDGRSLANRLSKYSTGIVTKLKYHPIENHQWKAFGGRSSGWHAINDKQWGEQAPKASQQPSTDNCIEGEPFTYVDLPGQLARLHKKPVEDLTKAEKHASAAELQVQQWSMQTVLNPKYFDLDDYMEQAKSYKDDYPLFP